MLKSPPTPWRAIYVTVFAAGAMMMATGATGQIFRDDTGTQIEGALTPDANGVFEIDGAAGIRAGANDEIVLHSMREFNLATGETARYVDSDPAMQASALTVLTRVTGGSGSVLDGRIESLYPNADLFFVNPNGVFFGANFTIDVPQSFHTSTADFLDLESGVSISTATPSDIPTLTSAVPMAWRFLGAGPEKRIEVDGFTADDTLAVTQGNAFTFVGSEIVSGSETNFTTIETNGRDFVAVALGGAGSVTNFAGVDNPAGVLDIQVAPTGLGSLGQITFFSSLSTRGSGAANGDILLFGGPTVLQGSFSSQGTGGTQDGGDFTVLALDSLSFSGNATIGGRNGGDGGDLIFSVAGPMDLTGNLSTANTGVGGGTAGAVGLVGSTSFSGTELSISAGGGIAADSDAGAIVIQSDNVNLDGFRLDASASGTGEGGGISIAGRIVTLATTNEPIDVSASGSGDAGAIIINVAETLDLDGVTLDASNTGTGDGGLIAVVDTPGLTFTADSSFAFDVSAADPGATDGMFSGRMPNIVSGPAPPAPPGDLPPPSETNDVIASLDQVISFTANETMPSVADDSLFGAADDFAATEPDPEADSGSTELAEADEEEEEEEEELADTPGPSDSDATLSAVASDIASTLASTGGTEEVTSATDTGEGDESNPAALLAALEEDQPEAAVTAAVATSTSKKGATTIPGISLFTRAAERAPLMPRTCDVLANTGGGSRLLARNPRRQPISAEDWLLAFDESGDQLLAIGAESLPSVGTQASADSAASGSRDRQGEIQQAFAAAAVAIRGDRYGEAASRFTTAVDSLEAAGDERGATQALMAFAQLQFEDGRFSGARETLERALALAIAAGDETSVAKARQSLGNALVGVGDLSGAEEELTRGLGVALAAEDKGPAASMLNDLGNRHAAKRDYKSALWAYERAADLAGDLGRVGDEARALAGAARVAVDVSRLDDAWRLLERADSIRGNARSARARASLAIHVGRTFAELANVTNDKRAEALLRSSAAFESAIQDAEASGDTYSLALANLNLGSLYKDEQHHSEALYLTRLARKDAAQIGAPELIYRAHWQEGQILWSAHRVRDALASHRRAIAILEETKPVSSDGYGATEANFQRSVGGVYRDHVDLLLRSSELATSAAVSGQLIAEARETLEKLKGAEIRDYFEDECIASVRKEKRTIEAGVAIVHTIMLPDRLELLVTLPTGIERFSTKISASNLMYMIDRFRTEVQNPRTDAYRPLARRLFDIVVAPYSRRLEEIGITTLIFIPDGRLRTLPFVALHDGVGFLGDRYATATTLSLNLLANRDLATQTGAPVLAGVSESVQGFVALESVDEELIEIQGLGGGELLLNQAFTLDRVKSAVANEVPGILHLATHAVFTGNPDTSFLLTYGGRVGFDELADVVGMTRAGGAPLDLLVLSACETAVGNDRAGLGFTGSAIRAGARSAVGSLWPIADEAARQLMVEFYMNLQSSEVTKAGALQQAQAHLRHGAQYSHPAYWAPFTLVNDWL